MNTLDIIKVIIERDAENESLRVEAKRLQKELEVVERDRKWSLDSLSTSEELLAIAIKELGILRAEKANLPKQNSFGSSPEKSSIKDRWDLIADRWAVRLAAKLRANADKPGWREDSSEDLLVRVDEELEELREAVISRRIGALQQVIEEASDVAAMAMMVADVEEAGPYDMGDNEVILQRPNQMSRKEILDVARKAKSSGRRVRVSVRDDAGLCRDTITTFIDAIQDDGDEEDDSPIKFVTHTSDGLYWQAIAENNGPGIVWMVET